MSKSFVAHVDQELAVQLATGLIGSEVSLSKQSATTAGLNFKVIFTGTQTDATSRTTKVENLLPEVLVEALRQETPVKAKSLDGVRERLLPGAADGCEPGTALLISECQLESLGETEGVLMGEECRVALLKSGQFDMRAYFRPEHDLAVRAIFNQPLEALGILRYTSPYPASGAVALNLGFRLVAAWLR